VNASVDMKVLIGSPGKPPAPSAPSTESAPSASNTTPSSVPAVDGQPTQPNQPQEADGLDGDRVLANSILFLEDFGWWIEAAHAIPEGDIGWVNEILKVCRV
jgi:hypothetical protein